MRRWTGKRAAVFTLAGMLAAGGAAAPAVTVDAAKSSLEKSAEKLVKKEAAEKAISICGKDLRLCPCHGLYR